MLVRVWFLELQVTDSLFPTEKILKKKPQENDNSFNLSCVMIILVKL